MAKIIGGFFTPGGIPKNIGTLLVNHHNQDPIAKGRAVYRNGEVFIYLRPVKSTKRKK